MNLPEKRLTKGFCFGWTACANSPEDARCSLILINVLTVVIAQAVFTKEKACISAEDRVDELRRLIALYRDLLDRGPTISEAARHLRHIMEAELELERLSAAKPAMTEFVV